VRKVYHVLAMALFVPVFFWDLQLLALSLAIAFAALALLEVTRCLRLPLLGAAVQQFMQKFVDERDAGAIYITHFTLLLGLAVPMWLCLSMPGTDALLQAQAALHQQQHSAGSAWQALHNLGGLLVTTSSGGPAAAAGRSVGSAWARAEAALQLVLLGLSGIVIIGIGDTAASLFGKLYGRLPVHAGSRKTVEGTVAGILLSLGGWVGTLWTVGLLPALASAAGAAWWAQLVAATVGAGLLEAATSQLDNILLPLWYAPHVLLLPAAH
jgi:dolichol kinase